MRYLMALITLEEYKGYYAISSPTHDGRLTILIDLVSELVENYISRELAPITYTNKTFELLGTMAFLDNFPIRALTTLEFFSSSTSTWVAIPDTDYELDEDNGTVEIFNSVSLADTTTSRSKPIRATYDGGYATLPADIKLAIFDLVTYYNKREQNPVRGMAGQSIDNSSATNGSEMPPHIKRVLSLYRVPG